MGWDRAKFGLASVRVRAVSSNVGYIRPHMVWGSTELGTDWDNKEGAAAELGVELT